MATKNSKLAAIMAKKKVQNPSVQQRPAMQKAPVAANIALDSGAVAAVPKFEQPIDRRGPFDMGLCASWCLYSILIALIISSLTGLVLFVVSMFIEIFGSPTTEHQALKFFGIVLTSTVLLSSCLLLTCFWIQHAKEVGWLPNSDSKSGANLNQTSQNANITGLYSIDPGFKQHYTPPLTPSHLQASYNPTVSY